MTLASPWFAAAALAVAILALWRARTRVAALESLAAIALLLAAARPSSGPASEKRSTPAALIAVIDASRSMLAADPEPSRFAVARARIEERCRREPGRKIGVIAFAGAPWRVAPPSADHAAVIALLAELDPARVVAQGSEVAAALALAIEQFGDVERGGDVLLLTDGEWDGEAPEPLRETAVARGIRIEAIAIGSPRAVALPPEPSAGSATETGAMSTAAPARVERFAAAAAPAAGSEAGNPSPRSPIGVVSLLLSVALLSLLAAHGSSGAER